MRGEKAKALWPKRPQEQEPILRWIYNLLTGEWLLNGRPNGGDVILMRSLLISLILYIPAMAMHSWAGSGWSFDFDLHALGQEVHDSLPWIGAIFAGAYVALYTRFSAQWSYLADVHNQIMAAECGIADPTTLQRTNLDIWEAAFVEDAVSLHLAMKKGFAELVWGHLQDEYVRTLFEDSVGVNARETLQKALQQRYPQLVVKLPQGSSATGSSAGPTEPTIP